jgi:hypothetical protein
MQRKIISGKSVFPKKKNNNDCTDNWATSQSGFKDQNSERNTERPTEIRTDSNASNGFLKCRFLPKQEETPTVQDCKERLKIERDFYQSLSNFARQYNIEPMQTKDFGFPYNIALAMWDLEKKVEQVNEDWNSFKLIRNNRKILL